MEETIGIDAPSKKSDAFDKKISEYLEHLKTGAKTPDSYILKRAFGNTVETADLRTVIAYMNVMYNKPTDVSLLIASMYYTYHNSDETASNAIPFEAFLGRLYQNSADSTKRKIENLLQLNINESNRFSSLFRNIADVVAREYGIYAVDYRKLFKDLYGWDKYDNIRKQWAMTVILPENKNTDEDKEKQA